MPNGSFLNGITRQRLIGLMRDDGIEVQERTVTIQDVHDADEISIPATTARCNRSTRFEDRKLQPGPIYRRARELYWDFAHSR